jgi:hypothetical protein
METVKQAIVNMTEDEQFEVLKLLNKTFYIPVVMSKEYLSALLNKTEESIDIDKLKDNPYLIDKVHDRMDEIIQDVAADWFEDDIDDESNKSDTNTEG